MANSTVSTVMGSSAVNKAKKAAAAKTKAKTVGETEQPTTRGVINTYGALNKHTVKTSNINLKIIDDHVQYIHDNASSNMNMTLVLNELIRRGIESFESDLQTGDIDILSK